VFGQTDPQSEKLRQQYSRERRKYVLELQRPCLVSWNVGAVGIKDYRASRGKDGQVGGCWPDGRKRVTWSETNIEQRVSENHDGLLEIQKWDQRWRRTWFAEIRRAWRLHESARAQGPPIPIFRNSRRDDRFRERQAGRGRSGSDVVGEAPEGQSPSNRLTRPRAFNEY
jgi:hypothetical protein